MNGEYVAAAQRCNVVAANKSTVAPPCESNPIQSNEFRRAQDVLYARIFTIEQLNTTQ